MVLTNALTGALKQAKLGPDHELLGAMGVNFLKGLFKLPGNSLTIEDIAEGVCKFNPDLGIEVATTKVPQILKMKFRVPGGEYSFVEISGKYRLEYNPTQGYRLEYNPNQGY